MKKEALSWDDRQANHLPFWLATIGASVRKLEPHHSDLLMHKCSTTYCTVAATSDQWFLPSTRWFVPSRKPKHVGIN